MTHSRSSYTLLVQHETTLEKSQTTGAQISKYPVLAECRCQQVPRGNVFRDCLNCSLLASCHKENSQPSLCCLRLANHSSDTKNAKKLIQWTSNTEVSSIAESWAQCKTHYMKMLAHPCELPWDRGFPVGHVMSARRPHRWPATVHTESSTSTDGS